MENDARSKYTINFTRKALTLLSQHTHLEDPEQVKTFIAKRNSANGYKRNLAIAYNKYCKYYGMQWNMPCYHPEPKAIKIPTKEKIQMLIAKALPPLSTKLQISMETGLRPIELCNLKVKDIDLEQKLIYPITAKNGSPKRLKISQQLSDTIQKHIDKHKLNPNDKLFTGNAAEYGAHYRAMRNRLADKLHDPTIKNIRLYDLRHYYATTLYAKTRDILLVKQQMGHKKNRNNTHLHATTKPERRRMDLQSSHQHRTSNPTNRSRIRIRHRNRRKQTIQKTQITLFFSA